MSDVRLKPCWASRCRCRCPCRRRGMPAKTDFTLDENARILSYRARQLYKNISILFLFPVKDGKLSTGVNATFNASCYG